MTARKPSARPKAPPLGPEMRARILELHAKRVTYYGIARNLGVTEGQVSWAVRGAEFVGDPPPVRWLVDGLIPLAVPGLLAAMGGAGKSFLALDLALRVVAGDRDEDGPRAHWSPFGAPVAIRGSAVMITGEDGVDTVHRRLHILDPGGARRLAARANGHQLRIVALPNHGGSFPVVRNGRAGLEVTDEARELLTQLKAVPNLRLVVLDPLQVFAWADVNADPAAAQIFCSFVATVAAETGATVIVAHHMRKEKEAPKDASEARAAIRGTTGIVDGMRFALALWEPDRKTAGAIADRFGGPLKGKVLKLATVKANERARNGEQTLWWQNDAPMINATDEAAGAGKFTARDLETLALDIAFAAECDQPLTKTGQNGVAGEQKAVLSHPLSGEDISRDTLRVMVDMLLGNGKVVFCQVGSRMGKVLDVPGGPWATAKDPRPFSQGERKRRPESWRPGMDHGDIATMTTVADRCGKGARNGRRG